MDWKRHIVCLALALGPIGGLMAQAELPEMQGMYLGLGIGQEVGGVGANLAYWPAPWLAGFAGGGLAFAGFAYQTGIDLRLPTEKRTSPFLSLMYGYTAALHIKGLEHLDRIDVGPSIGAGVMLKARILRNYWRFSVNYPVRSSEFMDHYEKVKNRPDVEMQSTLLPITFGISYHLGM